MTDRCCSEATGSGLAAFFRVDRNVRQQAQLPTVKTGQPVRTTADAFQALSRTPGRCVVNVHMPLLFRVHIPLRCLPGSMQRRAVSGMSFQTARRGESFASRHSTSRRASLLRARPEGRGKFECRPSPQPDCRLPIADCLQITSTSPPAPNPPPHPALRRSTCVPSSPPSADTRSAP